MIYNLLIATILIVAFFTCYKTMEKSKEEDKERIVRLNSTITKCVNQIETLRSESLNSYRKGLYDGLEIKKDNVLVVESKPVKTFEEYNEINETKKEIKEKEKEIESATEEYWKP